MKATTTIHHETYGAGSLVSHDGTYVVVRFGTASHKFRADSAKLSGVPTVQAQPKDDGWKRASIHGQSAGYRRVKATHRPFNMSAGKELGRLVTKTSAAGRFALDAARNIAPESLRDLEPKPWAKRLLEFAQLDGAALSRTAREAIKVIAEAVDDKRLDPVKAREMAKAAAKFQDPPAKPRPSTVAKRNEARIQGIQGVLNLTPEQRSELLARHRAKGAPVVPR